MARKDIIWVLGGIALGAFAVFVFLSLLTYTPENAQGVSPGWRPNLCGSVGALLSYALLQTFGMSAFVLVPLLGFWTWLVWRRKPIPRIWLKVIGSLIILFIFSALENLISFRALSFSDIPSVGGAAGFTIHRYLLESYGVIGGLIVCIVFLAAGFLFILEEVAIKAAKAFWRLCHRGAVAGWAQASAKVKEKRDNHLAKRAATTIVKKAEADAPPEHKPAKPATEREPAVRRTPEPKPAPPVPPPTLPSGKEYQMPPFELIEDSGESNPTTTRSFIQKSIETLNKALEDFDIDAAVVDYRRGPTVTMFEIELAAGVKVHRVMALSSDLAMALKVSGLRVVAPIPGKSTVGIEVPNSSKELVRLKEVLKSEAMKDPILRIPLMIGKDTSGRPIIEDLARMPHLLIAGTTGSGKSVCVASIIMSILFTRRPDEVNMILVDPKMVELSAFKDIPHLITPVVTDMKKAPTIFEWAVQKMDDRYELLARAGVKNIEDYNRLGKARLDAIFEDAEGVGGEEIPYHLPYIVVVVDELADLMMVAAKDIQNSVIRLAQKSRAVGVHVAMATQRPSVDVITGLIKSNIPARIAFQVASKVDSRTILDKNGAETLLGCGDMLFLSPGTSELTRAQGTFVNDAEIKRVVEFVRAQAQPRYSKELSSWTGEDSVDGQGKDELYDEAVRIVLESQRGSVSLLQRRLEIGYTRAARLIDMMAADGLVGEYKGSKAREVLVSLEEWEARRH